MQSSDTLILEVTKEDIANAYSHALAGNDYDNCAHCAVAVSAKRHGVAGFAGYTRIALTGPYDWVAENSEKMRAFVIGFDTVAYIRDGVLPKPITLHFKKEFKNRDHHQA